MRDRRRTFGSSACVVLSLLAGLSCKDPGLVGTEALTCEPACDADLICDAALGMCMERECGEGGCAEAGAPVCEDGACGECRDADDCQDGGACVAGRCAACASDADCDGDDVCRMGRCVEDEDDEEEKEKEEPSDNSGSGSSGSD